MNYHNAVSRYQGGTVKTRSRSRSTRRRNAANADPGKTWFKSGGATPDDELREVVAQRFMNMNQDHDRIRMKLLAGR